MTQCSQLRQQRISQPRTQALLCTSLCRELTGDDCCSPTLLYEGHLTFLIGDVSAKSKENSIQSRLTKEGLKLTRADNISISLMKLKITASKIFV